MELLADGTGWLGNGLVAFVLGLLVYMGRVDRNWMRESLKELRESLKEQREALKELGEKVDRNAAEAKAEREKGFADAKAEREKGFAEAKAGLEEAKTERENLRILLSQVAERTARIEGRQQGRAEIRLESRLQELIEEHGVASSAASD